MGGTVRTAAIRFHRTKPVSAQVRLAQMWGCSEKTAELRLSGDHSVFRMAADALAVAVGLGQTERVALWLDILEAPLMGTGVLPYAEAQHGETLADAAEDIEEAHYRLHPCKATAEALIRKSAHCRLKMEQRERALKVEHGL